MVAYQRLAGFVLGVYREAKRNIGNSQRFGFVSGLCRVLSVAGLRVNFFFQRLAYLFFASVVLLVRIVYYCIVDYLLNETLLK